MESLNPLANGLLSIFNLVIYKIKNLSDKVIVPAEEQGTCSTVAELKNQSSAFFNLNATRSMFCVEIENI